MAKYTHTIGAALILEGSCFGNIINAGLAINRFRLRVEGPGGHSWAESSAPSAVHTLVRVAAALTDRVSLPRLPRTTLNIGLIEGGISVNSRAPSASMTIDLRSEDPETLQLVTNDIYALFETFMTEPGITFTTEMVGERPGGRLDERHPLVREAISIYSELGVRNARPTISSTDANLLFDSEIPTICIGISTGGDAHSMGEYINTRPIPSGMAALTALALRAAHAMREWHRWPSGSH
jgi:di/tripeptidase